MCKLKHQIKLVYDSSVLVLILSDKTKIKLIQLSRCMERNNYLCKAYSSASISIPSMELYYTIRQIQDVFDSFKFKGNFPKIEKKLEYKPILAEAVFPKGI